MKHRCTYRLAAAILLAWCVAPSGAQTNLLDNWGFETGDLPPWGGYGNRTVEVVQDCVGAAIPAGPVEGDYCLHVTVPAPGANNWDMGIQYQFGTFEQGKKYTWAAFLKSKSGTVDVRFKPELGASPYTAYGEQVVTLTEEWQEFYTTTPVFTSSVTPATLTWHIGFAAAEFWIDGVRFFEGDYVPPDFLDRPAASKPAPDDGATDVRLDPTLSWRVGDFAAGHDVYFGTSFADVNDASRADPRGVLVSENQPDAVFTPDRLAVDTTYYWRVDEVNAPPAPAIFKGTTWSFTTEPVAYEVTGVSASATSVFQDTMGPANTVNGAGLNGAQHGTDMETMWLSAASADGAEAITYDLGQVYKLYRAQIWNHNSQSEKILGYGIKDARIEVSEDGQAWSEFATLQLAQASGAGTYAGTDLSLNGSVARYVRITALSNYSLLGFKQYGLSEIRFYYLPIQAREPQPADGATSDGIDVSLAWRPGREAVTHQVVFGQDLQAVSDNTPVAGSTAETSFDAGTLDLGSVYFWKVNEVNDASVPALAEGPVWVLLTPEVISIDDMEMYRAEDGLFIWQHWVDGFDDPANNGAVVGNGDDPETGEVHQGAQSLPLAYDNTAAPISEATRSFDPPLNLAAGNPERIEIFFKGRLYEFNGYYSADGSNWTPMGWNPQTVAMSDDALIGLALTSHDAAAPTTAAFSGVTTTGSVTGNWTQADIGGTHPAGNFSLAGNVFTIEAAGADIWNAADEFRYVYKAFTGEASITARVDSLAQGHDWAKAGVMIRDAAVPESSFAAVLQTGANGIRYQARLNTGVNATADDATLDGAQQLMSAPSWVRIERKVANGAAPVYLTLTDRAGKSATIQTDDPAATQATQWTSLGAAPADLNVDLTQIVSITLGVGGNNVQGTIYADTLRTMTQRQPHYDLFAHYALDGDTMDSSGNGFDGVVTGDPNYVAGVSGQALEFSAAGGDDYVTIGTMDPSFVSGRLSLSLWAKWNGLSDQWQGLIGKRDAWDAAQMMWHIEANRDSGTLGFARNGSGVNTSAVLPQGEWEHVGVSFDGSTAKVFIGGVLNASGGFSFGTGNRASMQFGCGERNGGNSFNGALDEIRIYDRALSDAEMADLAAQP